MGPLNALRAGDPNQVIQLATATASMFTVRGDGVWLYNVSGRPVFPEPISGTLFYAGLLIALWRWRKPEYALALIWLPISLGPAAISWPAPNFVRALGALPVAFIFPGIAVHSIVHTINVHIRPRTTNGGLPPTTGGRRPAVSGRIATLAIMAALFWNVTLTARDYFAVWSRNPEVRWLYQATWTQAADWLDAETDTTPVAASGLKIHDLDPQTYDLVMRRRDVKVKWFDCRTSILLPGSGVLRYISPDFFPCDADLWTRFLGDARIITQPRWADSGQVIFTAYRLESYLTGLSNSPNLGQFGPLLLTGSEITRPAVAPGGEADLLTFWRITGADPAPIKIFVHVIDDDGRPLAQWDGFDFGETQLEPGDRLIERHRFTVPVDITPGEYRIIGGIYNPSTGRRLTLPDGSDHTSLGMIQVR
jgi:hypothetical protein